MDYKEQISQAEFDLIVKEITDENGVSFNAMLKTVSENYMAYVKGLCKKYGLSADDSHAGQIMSEVKIFLCKKAVPNFFRRENLEGGLNLDRTGFMKWVNSSIGRIAINYVVKVRRYEKRNTEYNPELGDSQCDIDENYFREERLELLNDAFNIVMNSDSNIYIVLTWLAHSMLMLSCRLTKPEANAELIKEYENKTLDFMYKSLLTLSEEIGWLKLSEENFMNIEKRLDKQYKDGRPYRDIVYSELFMKKGGPATVSDWLNRMNSRIRLELANETSYN